MFGLKHWFKERDRLFVYLNKQIAKHRESFDGTSVRDFIDAFLLEMNSNQSSPKGSHYFTGTHLIDILITC